MYQADQPPLELARLYALRDRLKARYAEVDTLLRAHPLTAHMVTPDFGGPMAPEYVKLGDQAGQWPLMTNGGTPNGAIRVRVFAGTGREGTSLETSIEYLGDALKKVRLFTSVCAYIHLDALPDIAGDDWTETCEIAAAALSGWMRNVCNAGRSLVLPSREYQPVGGTQYDRLCPTWVQTGTRGYFPLAFGDDIVAMGVQVLHYGEIA